MLKTCYARVFVTILLVGGIGRAGEIETKIFHDGLRRRGEEYARARDVLVRQGPKLSTFLQSKTDSEDWGERMFARILICRIQQPQEIAQWDKALGKLVNDRNIRQALKTYREPQWEKLPNVAEDVPASHLVDVLWESKWNDTRHTAAALQFYIAPRYDAIDATLEFFAIDANLKFLALEGYVKLGAAAVPRMRQVLRKTLPPKVKNPHQLTRYEQDARRVYWRQMSRATVAAAVLARQQDFDSIPLIVKCLNQDSQNHEYIEGLSGALAKLKAVSAIDAILNQLLRAAAQRNRTGGNGVPGYDVLRSHVVNFGKQSLPALRNRLHAAEGASDRIILEHLIVQLSDGDATEQAIAAQRESLWFAETAPGLLKLHEMTGEDVFPRLSARARGIGPQRLRIERQKNAIITLGGMREIRAVPLLSDILNDQHTYWQQILDSRTVASNAGDLDPQRIRLAAESFGRVGSDLADSLDLGDGALLALRQIGSKDARKVLLAACEFLEYKTRAETSLLFVDGRIDRLTTLLNDKNYVTREEAALALMENGDHRATHQLLCAAARRQGAVHKQWKVAALLSNRDITSHLRKLLHSEDVRQRVLAESMLLEANSPEKATECRQSLRTSAEGVAMMHVFSIRMVEAAGRGLASKRRIERADLRGIGQREPKLQPLDESHVPLVEAACLFDEGVIYRGVAAFALAEWNKPRSMLVLAASFNMGSLGGSNPAALALVDFGAEGAELAADVPAPKPGQYDTGLRMTTHRASARVLSEQKDIRGVDEILKGLKTLDQDRKLDMWSYRAGIYLSAAAKYHDRRLVDPLIRILSTPARPQRDVHETTIKLLAAYDDSRLAPLFAQRLTTTTNERTGFHRGEFHELALMALTRQMGAKTPAFLLDHYEDANDDRVRCAVLLAFGELSCAHRPPFPGKTEWSPQRFKTTAEREEIAAQMLETAYPILVAALDDPSANIHQMAAIGLTIIGQANPDRRSIDLLTGWSQQQRHCFYPLTEHLGKHGTAESGRVLLEILRSQRPERGDTHLVSAIGMLKPAGTVAVLDRNIRACFAVDKRRAGVPNELVVMAELGEPGIDAVFAILCEVDQMNCQLAAAQLLSQKQYKEATVPLAKFVLGTIEAGLSNPKLIPQNHESPEEAYVRTCTMLIDSLNRLDAQQAKQIAEKVILNGPSSLGAVCLRVWVDE